jgi:hypothetical protein
MSFPPPQHERDPTRKLGSPGNVHGACSACRNQRNTHRRAGGERGRQGGRGRANLRGTRSSSASSIMSARRRAILLRAMCLSFVMLVRLLAAYHAATRPRRARPRCNLRRENWPRDVTARRALCLQHPHCRRRCRSSSRGRCPPSKQFLNVFVSVVLVENIRQELGDALLLALAANEAHEGPVTIFDFPPGKARPARTVHRNNSSACGTT